MSIAQTPQPPYYAVIFSSERTNEDNGYSHTGALMEELAQKQPGFLGIESARESLGITVSYWKDLESIQAWKEDTQHLIAQRIGKEVWYEKYKTRICKVDRDYGFDREETKKG